MAANTPTTYYKDSFAAIESCKTDFDKIKKNCGPDDEKGKQGQPKKVRPPIRKLLGDKYKDKKYGSILTKGGTDKQGWMRDNCDFLWVSPSSRKPAEFLDKVDKLREDLAEAVDTKLKEIIDDAKEKITDKAWDMAKKKGTSALARSGGRWAVGATGAAVGGVGAIVTEGVATAWNLWDMVTTGYEVVTEGYDAYKELKKLNDVLKDYESIGDELRRLSEQAKRDPQRAFADFMEGVARLNPCIRARRCSLVPKGKANSQSGEGCCPGQTGHHLIPDAAVKDAGCHGYDYEKAPTVCAEGTGNSHGGSHGKLHGLLDDLMEKYRKHPNGGPTMSYSQYQKKALTTFYKAFPESGCNRNCLKAQLDDHYQCSKDLKAVSGRGGAGSDRDTTWSNTINE